MRRDGQTWFRRRSSAMADWQPERLLAAKGDVRVDVILPALNEQDTVGGIVHAIRSRLMTAGCPLVDELVVVDSGSVDRTGLRAREAGARVIDRESVLPELVARSGKGEAMWRGLAATSGEIVVFLDADLRSFTPGYVVGLLGPLLTDPTIHMVKAAYDRPLLAGDRRVDSGGGRVTEILARPLVNALWPDLAGVAQPLAGEYAARRSLLELLPFPCGYGVEIALLVDAYLAVGLDGIAQVDLGVREHRHQAVTELSTMSAEVLHAAMTRADPRGAVYRPPQRSTLPGFSHTSVGIRKVDRPVQVRERPPLASIREYRLSHPTAASLAASAS